MRKSEKVKDAALTGLLNLIRMFDYLLTLTARSSRFYNAADCKQHCILKSGQILIFVCVS